MNDGSRARPWLKDPTGDPEVTASIGWMRDVNDETRSRLAVAWDYQSKHLGDLVSTSSALLTTIRQMQVATRRRALLEMAGLLMVAVGTVLSSLPVDRG